MKRLIPILIFTLLFLNIQPIQSAAAASWTVNALDDSDDGSCDTTHCSLREAIHYAANGDTINFSVEGTITLEGTELAIDKDLTIDGPGASQLIVSANLAKKYFSRIFYIPAGNVTITGMTITNGYAKNSSGGGIYNLGNLVLNNIIMRNTTAKDGGGAIANLGGSLVIYNSVLTNNESGNGAGGAIYNQTGSSLEVTFSTISGNSAKESGGGIYNLGTASLQSTTVSGNSSSGGAGGGIYNHSSSNFVISDCTFSDNSAKNNAGGIVNLGILDLKNTIVANSGILPQNNPGEDCYSHVTATVNDQGYNLIEYANSACGLTSETNIIGQDPNLGILNNNGGSTPTHALRDPSPAFDQIPNGVNGCMAGSSTDQRGAVRGGGTDQSGYLSCDIGAFEMASFISPTAIQLRSFSARDNSSHMINFFVSGGILIGSLICISLWLYRRKTVI